MNTTTILFAIITIVLADYLLERGLSFLNCRSISTQPPDEVKGIYSEEKYQQSQGSTRGQTAGLSWSPPALQVVILLALLMGGGVTFIDGLVRGMVQC
jgi:hypothetical protein